MLKTQLVLKKAVQVYDFVNDNCDVGIQSDDIDDASVCSHSLQQMVS